MTSNMAMRLLFISRQRAHFASSTVARCNSAHKLARPTSAVSFESSRFRRPFSGDATAVEEEECISKLRTIFEEYRKKNYTQTLPSRFKKEVVAAADKNNDGVISTEEIKELLKNIGAEEQLSKRELERVMEVAGVKGDIVAIPIRDMMKIL